MLQWVVANHRFLGTSDCRLLPETVGVYWGEMHLVSGIMGAVQRCTVVYWSELSFYLRTFIQKYMNFWECIINKIQVKEIKC